MKPFWQFFHAKFYDYRVTHEYKQGVRTIMSIQYEPPCGSLLSKEEVWMCPIVHVKIILFIVMINIYFPWGRIKRSGWGPIDRDEDCSH